MQPDRGVARSKIRPPSLRADFWVGIRRLMAWRLWDSFARIWITESIGEERNISIATAFKIDIRYSRRYANTIALEARVHSDSKYSTIVSSLLVIFCSQWRGI